MRSVFRTMVTSEAFDERVARGAAWVAAPIFFTSSVVAVARWAETNGEIVTGILAAIAATLGLVILGIVLPRAR